MLSPEVTGYFVVPVFIPDNPDKLVFTYGGDYYKDYWLKHKDQMTQVVDQFYASSSFEITKPFSKYLWLQTTIPTTFPKN